MIRDARALAGWRRELGGVLLLASAMLACTPAPQLASAPAVSPRADTVVYDGRVSVDPQSHHLSGRWVIGFVADTATRDSATFLLNAGLHVTPVAASPGAQLTVHPLGDGRQMVSAHFDPALTPGRSAQIEIAYEGVPEFGTDTINGMSPHWVELGLDSFWLPIFSGFDKRLVADVDVTLPTGWTLVTSGIVTRKGQVAHVRARIPLPDVAFTAAPRSELFQIDSAGTSVFYVRESSPDSGAAVAARVLGASAACRRYLNDRYGVTTPLPPVKLVVAPRGGPGYARENYIVITAQGATGSAASLGAFICHEFAHYWSIAANSSGPENWLNEGIAEYVSGRFVRAQFGVEAYATKLAQWERMSRGQPPVWTPALRTRPSAVVAYRKAPYLLSELETRIGVAAMDRLLARYMTERMQTTPQLLAALGEIAGPDQEAWFRDQLAR